MRHINVISQGFFQLVVTHLLLAWTATSSITVLFHLTVSHRTVSHGGTLLHSRLCPWIIHLSQQEEPTSISTSIFPFFSKQQTFGRIGCIIQTAPVLALNQLRANSQLRATTITSFLMSFCCLLQCGTTRVQKKPLREVTMFCFLSTHLFCPYSSLKLRQFSKS